MPLSRWACCLAAFLAIAFGGGPRAARAQSLEVGAAHSCTLLPNGTVKCWGANRDGQLGLGDTHARGDGPGEMGADLPTVDLGGPVAAIAAGAYHTCALLSGGSVKCWGSNRDGQLGLGDTQARGDGPGEMGSDLPAVDLGGPATAIAAGAFHSCALVAGSAVKCWGSNRYGQLGLGDTQARGDGPGEMGAALPSVALHGPVETLALGNDHACALLKSGGVQCWGYGGFGQLGYGDTRARGDGPGEMGAALPVHTFSSSVRSLVAGADHTCLVRAADASLRCWGRADQGQIGSGARTALLSASAAPAVSLPAPAIAAAAAGDHTCAVLDGSGVACWGSNAFGQLGLGDTQARGDDPGEMGTNLSRLDLPSAPSSLALGATHTCALFGDGGVQCWGSGAAGRLGTGQTTNLGDQPGEMGSNLPFVDIGVVLPVELVGFHARADGRSVRLDWSTASETNNAGFTVEQDGGDGRWASVGFVEGAGSTLEARSYQFRVDPLAPGRYRFRLVQRDLDGRAHIGPAVTVAVGVTDAFALVAAGPEPFRGRTRYVLHLSVPQRVRASLHDALGREVATVADAEGGATLDLPIDAAALGPGRYVLRVQGERFFAVRTVTVAR